MTGGLTSQLISGLIGTVPGTQDVFPQVLGALVFLGMGCPVGFRNLLSTKFTLELGAGGVV